MITTRTEAADIAVIRSSFEALARGDLATFGEAFHIDATWNHRNDDRLGGLHVGRDGIVSFVAESAAATSGTLRAVPEAIMTDDQGHVSVLTHMSGTRPDGRSFDVLQVLLFSVDADRVRHVDQFVGDPVAVKAFWA